MCECNPCECCWWNCGSCNGCAGFFLCGTFWCCKPFMKTQFDGDCCHCFEQSGIGFNVICLGMACCIPDWLLRSVQIENYPRGRIQSTPH